MASDGTGDFTWGHLEDTEVYGRRAETEDFIVVDKDNLSPELKVTCKASHGLIYTRSSTKAFNVYSIRAIVLMQMRFDGYLGFPGGLIDPGESSEFALNREMEEEMGLDLTKHSVQPCNHVISHYNKKTGLLCHFYALEVTMEELRDIELRALQSKDYGFEVQGTFRVPLFTLGDGYRGFPNFLKNMFAGNSKEQLVYTLKKLNIMTEEEIQHALNAFQ